MGGDAITIHTKKRAKKNKRGLDWGIEPLKLDAPCKTVCNLWGKRSATDTTWQGGKRGAMHKLSKSTVLPFPKSHKSLRFDLRPAELA